MRKKHLIFIALLNVPLLAHPQSSADRFTLQQCIEYALTNSYTIKNAEMDKEIAKARTREIIGMGLPQVNGEFSIIHNSKLQRFFTTYKPAGSEGFLDESLKDIPNIQPGDVVAAQNFFQLKSIGQASVSATQMIFNASYFVGLKAADAYKEMSKHTTEQARQNIVQQVTKMFYTVLINKERATIFDVNRARLDTLLRNTRALYKSGFAESIDIDRVQVLYNNLKAEQENFNRLSDLSLSALKQAMNYPIDQPLQTEGSIKDIQLSSLEETDPGDYKNRPDYKVTETNIKWQELNLKNIHAAALPSLFALGNWGYMSQSPDIGGLFKTRSKIDDIGTVGPDKWYTYYNFGINLKVPLFSGLQYRHKVQQEKLKLVQTENNLKALESGIQLEIQNCHTLLTNAMLSLESQKQNMALAEKVARVTKIKFEQGVGSNLEVITAESDLRQAQVNYYNALYSAISAKVDRDKAYGILKQ